ncbi:MAG: tRNA-dihydrouridine synthase [Clostridia bacterium]|nr:tRNA-dihydrouridine synthase [Clostridia bacterium]
MNIHPVKIGALETPNNIFLAPLAGYTNAVFRRICRETGAGLTFTEMVSAKGLCYDNEKTKDLLFTEPEYAGIRACQLFGSDPEIMLRAAQSEELAAFELIDINMGCPMPKIYNNGEGSALMANPELAAKIIAACKKSGKAVSVKFRIGLEKGKICAAEFAKVCEGSGADMLTVHGRTRDKIYAGEVDFAAIEKAKSAVKIPVIANGGVFSKTDAETLLNETGADGVAVARGAMYAPWIFAEICGNPIPDKKQLILKQIDDTNYYFGERFACVFMRKMCAFYVKGQPNSAALRERLFKCATVNELKGIVNTLSF